MSAGAERARRFRQREAGSLVVLPIECDFAALSYALLQAGFIREDQIDDRTAVAAAAGKVLKLLYA